MSKKSFEKIPYCVKPVNYYIEFIPNVATFTFEGSQTIDIEVNESVDTVKLNAKELEVHSVSCNSKDAQVSYDADKELVIFKFADALPLGKGILSMKFKGIHNDNMKGFYRSAYKTPSGETIYNLATQMEATSARLAFPCIDEPDRKATFTITMVVPSNKVALSNMPEVSRVKVPTPAGLPADNYEKVTFDKTPIMSTYLLAMVVGNFDFIEDMDSNGVKIRVYAPPEKKHCCPFALKVAKDALPFYAECFGCKYPLPKLDLIAIPDFAAGAMENWGLVTYRETALLMDPVESSLATKQRIALVVAHELAHMWFGNLVTMKWWTHLWLNEGFATWMEYLCVDKVCPEFDIWTSFTTSEQSSAFSLDGLKSSHPIEVEVGHPDEVDEIFDSISYAKGASVINMLYNWIGHESFFCGLQNYMKKFQYGNTLTEDLWKAFSEASGKDVCQVMGEWTKKMGYPVLKVTSDAANANMLHFSQQRFLVDGSKCESQEYSWPIPFALAHSNSAKITHLLEPNDAASCQLLMPSVQNLLVNPGRSSFIRVQYTGELMKSLKQMLAQNMLGPRDRLAILEDNICLGLAGHLPLAEVIDLIQAYKGESHHIVWDSICFGLAHIRLLVEEIGMDHGADREKVKGALQAIDKLYQQLALPVFERLGWNPLPTDTHNETFLRSQILSILGRSGHAATLAEAKRRFDLHAGGQESIKSDIRMAVYSTCMRHGDKNEYDRMVELYNAAKMADEKVRILQCLGLSQNAELRKACLDFSMTNAVRKQDRYASIISVSGANPEGRRELWTFVKDNIKNLPDDLGSFNLLQHVLKASCKHFAHEGRLDEVTKFWKANEVPCKRAVQQATESISINMAQIARDGPSLIEKLSQL